MKIYAVHYDKFVDEEYESGVIDNKFYANEVDAYDKMLEEAQLTKDDWNENPPSNFELDIYPKVKCCSISAQFESDYYNLSIIELED